MNAPTPEDLLEFVAAEMRRQGTNELVVARPGGTPILVLLSPSRAKALIGAHITMAPAWTTHWRPSSRQDNQRAKAQRRAVARARGEKVKPSYRQRHRSRATAAA